MSVVTDPARPAVAPEAPKPVRRKGSFGFNSVSPREKVARYVLLVFVLLITIGPFLWQLSTSLKGSGEDIYTRIPRLLPAQPTFDHYKATSSARRWPGSRSPCCSSAAARSSSACSSRRWSCRVRSRSSRST
jgi:putative chitobiose transport system permease protein